MWNTIIESGIVAIIFGGVISIAGIIIANRFNKNKEARDRKYLLTNEIYNKLVEVYNLTVKINSSIDFNTNSAKDVFTESIIMVYKKSVDTLETLKKIFLSGKICFAV